MARKSKAIKEIRIVYFRENYDDKGERLELQSRNTNLSYGDEFGLVISCNFVHAYEYPIDKQEDKNFISFRILKEMHNFLSLGYDYIGWYNAENV